MYVFGGYVVSPSAVRIQLAAFVIRVDLMILVKTEYS